MPNEERKRLRSLIREARERKRQTIDLDLVETLDIRITQLRGELAGLGWSQQAKSKWQRSKIERKQRRQERIAEYYRIENQHWAEFQHRVDYQRRIRELHEENWRQNKEWQSSNGPVGEERARTPIPRSIKQQVWLRDGGVCRKCGITDAQAMIRYGEHLHYDHIIPFSRNGADTVDNLQLLCGPCNRVKSNRLK
jgi:5-methylcytosine-specific restriction endonuclease McrA